MDDDEDDDDDIEFDDDSDNGGKKNRKALFGAKIVVKPTTKRPLKNKENGKKVKKLKVVSGNLANFFEKK